MTKPEITIEFSEGAGAIIGTRPPSATFSSLKEATLDWLAGTYDEETLWGYFVPSLVASGCSFNDVERARIEVIDEMFESTDQSNKAWLKSMERVFGDYRSKSSKTSLEFRRSWVPSLNDEEEEFSYETR